MAPINRASGRSRLMIAEAAVVLAVVGLVVVWPSSLMGSNSEPAGKTIYAGCGPVDAHIFQSDALIHSHDAPEPLIVFDQSLLPSSYETCYWETGKHQYLKILRPYDNASFPRNIAPPNIRWEDETNDVWMLSLTAPGWSAPLRVVTKQTQWRPNAATWEAIKSSGTGEWINLEVRGCCLQGRQRLGDRVYVDQVRFRVSPYPADPIIVCRMVTPLFHVHKTPDVIYRDITTFETGMFLPGEGVFCTNCHSFPYVPTVAAEDIELAIAVRKQVGPQYRRLGLYNFATQQGRTVNVNSFFMGWDPEGKKVAACLAQKIASKAMITLETQEFFVQKAGIGIVDSETLQVRPLRGAYEPEYMETFPEWSVDGKTIVFSRAKEVVEPAFADPMFDMYQVPYNNGRGGKATPVPGAAHNGKSNYFPRFSPDGK